MRRLTGRPAVGCAYQRIQFPQKDVGTIFSVPCVAGGAEARFPEDPCTGRGGCVWEQDDTRIGRGLRRLALP